MYGLKEITALALAAGIVSALPQYGETTESASSSVAVPAASSTTAAAPYASSGAPAVGEECLKHYFAFGASFTQTMFNENQTQPHTGNPMGNPPKSQTYTGGFNYVDFLTQKYNSTPVYNYNFARGGATTSAKVVAPGKGIPTFEEQVHNHFMPKYGGADKTWNSNNTFFSFHFGDNDMLIPFLNPHEPTPDRFTRVPAILDAYFTIVEDLYKVGARRFMMVNVPPQDRTPMIKAMNGTVQQGFKDFIDLYNAQLMNRTVSFAASHDGAYTSYYDIHSFMSKVLDDPQAAGFPDDHCIDPTGQKCIFFNNFHPGEKFDDMWGSHMQVAMNNLGFNDSTPRSGYYAYGNGLSFDEFQTRNISNVAF